MRYFFYGTLMDPEILSLVTGRRFRGHDLVPARLADWRRAAVRGAPYPAIVPAAGRVIDGVVIDGVDHRMARRLTTYEGPGYRERVLEVDAGSDAVASRVFVPTQSMPVSRWDWSFDEWRKRHKRYYVRRLNRPGWQAE